MLGSEKWYISPPFPSPFLIHLAFVEINPIFDSGIVTEADFIFIPEWPVDKDAWKDNLCKKLETERDFGNR